MSPNSYKKSVTHFIKLILLCLLKLKGYGNIISLTPADESLAQTFDLPLIATYSHSAKKHLPKIGAYGQPNWEQLLTLTDPQNRKKTLILAGIGTPLETIQRLAKEGFSLIHFYDKPLLEGGKAFQACLSSFSKNLQIKHQLLQLEKNLKILSNKVNPHQRILPLIFGNPPVFACHGTPLAQALEWLGYENACPLAVKGHRRLSWEFLIQQKDVFILTSKEIALVLKSKANHLKILTLPPNLLFQLNYANLLSFYYEIQKEMGKQTHFLPTVPHQPRWAHLLNPFLRFWKVSNPIVLNKSPI